MGVTKAYGETKANITGNFWTVIVATLFGLKSPCCVFLTGAYTYFPITYRDYLKVSRSKNASNPKKKLGTRKYIDYSDETLRIAVEEVKKGSSLRKVAEKFSISRFAPTSALKGKPNRCGRPPVLTSGEERRLVECISMAAEWGFPLTALDARLIVKGYLDRCGQNEIRFKKNMPGINFIDSFLKRNSKDLSKRLGQNTKRSRAAISKDIVDNYFNEPEETLKDIDPSMVVKDDETNMTENPGRKQVIVRRGSRHPERIVEFSKCSTSVTFSGSVSGTLLPPYITYKAAPLYDSWTENGPAGTVYNRSKSGWFTLEIFEDWFQRVALPYFKRFDSDAKKVLIGDNLSSYISAHIIEECNKNKINFLLLQPLFNSTHYTQPLDVAFFRALKIKWRQILTEWKEANSGSIPKDRFPRFLKKCLDALGEENINKNLKSGFQAAGIVALDRKEILKRLPDGDATAKSNSSCPQIVYEELNSNKNWTDSIKAFFEESRKRETEPLKQRKKRKLNVPAGKGIEDTMLISDDDPQPSTSQTPDTKTKINHSEQKTFKPNKQLANADSSDDTDDQYSLRDSNSDMDPETFSDLEAEIDLQLEEVTYENPPKKEVSREELKPDVYVIVELIFNKNTKKETTKQKFYEVILRTCFEKSEVKVKFFRRSSKSKGNDYIFPIVDDEMDLQLTDVFSIVQPSKVYRGHYTFPYELKH